MLFTALAISLVTVQPPAGSPGGGPTPPPEFVQAAQAFGQCLMTNGLRVPHGDTPEVGATRVLMDCAQQQAAMESRFETWVAGPDFPEAERAGAREQMRSQLAQLRSQLAGTIRESRSAPAPAPQPSN